MKKTVKKALNRKVVFDGVKCDVKFEKYSNGRTAIVLLNNGEKYAIASVNVVAEPLEDGYVFIKDYSEGEGMLHALVEAKIVESTGRIVHSGFVTIPEVRIL